VTPGKRKRKKQITLTLTPEFQEGIVYLRRKGKLEGKGIQKVQDMTDKKETLAKKGGMMRVGARCKTGVGIPQILQREEASCRGSQLGSSRVEEEGK